MALIVKSKPAEAKVIIKTTTAKPKEEVAPVEVSQRQKDALEAMGLIDAPKKHTETAKERDHIDLYVGTRVVVSNNLFPWINDYKAGDVGTVMKLVKAPRIGVDAERHDLVDVKLDTTRTTEVVTLSRWELSLA